MPQNRTANRDMGKPRLLDLFCGQGGAAYGYHEAGFDVTGVDIKPQRHYPFKFIQADAMTFPLEGFDVIHASPPCQDHSVMRGLHGPNGTGWMLEATLQRVKTSGIDYVVENVPGAVFDHNLMLCGSTFGLLVRRHRLFATSFAVPQPECRHDQQGRPITVVGNGGGIMTEKWWKATTQEAMIGLGVWWGTRAGLSQMIPPAYTRYIGRHYVINAAAK